MFTLEELNARIAKLTPLVREPRDYVALRRLEWKRDILIAEHQVRQLRMAPMLLDAANTSGRVAVFLPDGRRMERDVGRGVNAWDSAYGLIADVEQLAWLATDVIPPLPLTALTPSLRPQPDR